MTFEEANKKDIESLMNDTDTLIKGYKFVPREPALRVTWDEMTKLTLNSNFLGKSAKEVFLDQAANEIIASYDYNSIRFCCSESGSLISYREVFNDIIYGKDRPSRTEVKLLRKFFKNYNTQFARDFDYVLSKADVMRRAYNKAWSKVTYSGWNPEPDHIPTDTWTKPFTISCGDICNKLYDYCVLKDEEEGKKTLSEATRERYERVYEGGQTNEM